MRRRPGEAPAGRRAGRPGVALLAAALAVTLGGCYLGSAAAQIDGGADSSGGGAAGATTGLPCDVAQVLAAACLSCHSAPPTGNAPMALVSYDDLTAPSLAAPSQTNAERAVARMQDPASPMPPGGPPNAADAAIIAAWIAAGYPRGDCAADGGTNPYATAPVCTSGQYLRGEEDLGTSMHPGGACLSCHQQRGVDDPEAAFAVAGTLFPTAHEYDDCVAAGVAGAQVVITDRNGGVHTASVNSVGNFVLRGVIPVPYTARVVYNGRERAMGAAQQSGDCNSCHTLNGANGAPGRVLLP